MRKETHDFYCTACGQKSLPCFRTVNSKEKGHLKKLWCPNCKQEVNCAEITNSYTVEMFRYEFEHHNFVNGERLIKVDTMIKHFKEEN